MLAENLGECCEGETNDERSAVIPGMEQAPLRTVEDEKKFVNDVCRERSLREHTSSVSYVPYTHAGRK